MTLRRFCKGLGLLALFLVIGFAIDRAGFALVESGMPNDTRVFYQEKRSLFMDKRSADILVMGDSRAAGGLDPRIIEDATGKTALNLSVYSTGPYQWRRFLQIEFDNAGKLPETVVIGATPKMFGRGFISGSVYTQAIFSLRPDLQFKATPDPGNVFTPQYLSCLYNNKEILLSQIGAFFRQKSTAVNKREVESTYNGFLYFYNAGDVADEGGDAIGMEIKPAVVEEFDTMLAELTQKGVRVIVVQTPYWRNMLARIEANPLFDEYLQIINDTCAKYGALVVNPDMHALDDELLETDYLDNGHVNAYGAEKFTRYFLGQVGWAD